jgi:serine/threonine protein kinase
MSPSIFP